MTLKELAEQLLKLSEKYPTHVVLDNDDESFYNVPITGVSRVREYVGIDYDGDVNYEIPGPHSPGPADAIVLDWSH